MGVPSGPILPLRFFLVVGNAGIGRKLDVFVVVGEILEFRLNFFGFGRLGVDLLGAAPCGPHLVHPALELGAPQAAHPARAARRAGRRRGTGARGGGAGCGACRLASAARPGRARRCFLRSGFPCRGARARGGAFARCRPLPSRAPLPGRCPRAALFRAPRSSGGSGGLPGTSAPAFRFLGHREPPCRTRLARARIIQFRVCRGESARGPDRAPASR
jgi:hypothetical protein